MFKVHNNAEAIMEPRLRDEEAGPTLALYRVAQAVTQGGARDVFEEAWMQPLFEVLSEEMDALMRDESPQGAAAERWVRTLRGVLVEEIKNLRNVEIELMRLLPKMAAAAAETSLRDGFEDQLEMAKEHGQRLDEVAEWIGISAKGRTCAAMEGFIYGIKEVIVENRAGEARDYSLVSAALKVEDYKIVCYGCARTFAQILGLEEPAALLEASYGEETALHAKLEYLAEFLQPQEEELLA